MGIPPHADRKAAASTQSPLACTACRPSGCHASMLFQGCHSTDMGGQGRGGIYISTVPDRSLHLIYLILQHTRNPQGMLTMHDQSPVSYLSQRVPSVYSQIVVLAPLCRSMHCHSSLALCNGSSASACSLFFTCGASCPLGPLPAK